MDKFAIMQRLLVTLAVLLTACATNQVSTLQPGQTTLSFDDSLFGVRPVVVSAAELFALREKQERAFLEFFHDPIQQSTPPHERVYEYLRVATTEFDFHNDTLTAAQALDRSSGNCLSLAILTTAFANLVNVETGYQLVDSTPVFELRGSVVSIGLHVRSLLFDPTWQSNEKTGAALKRPGIKFDYWPDDTVRVRLVGNLSFAEYIAMYYSNIAGESIATGDIDSAFWYLLESLKHAPENAIALNTLAVVYRRAGDEAMAERIYKFGIELLPANVSFLRNYRVLLKRQGRIEEAEKVSDLLAGLDDRNPFDWANAGRNAFRDGQYRDAINFFKKAVEIAPYLHEAYAGMALAYLRLGDTTRGERELNRAFENAQRQTTKSLYQAKLTVLGR